jgi:hypothetical protein
MQALDPISSAPARLRRPSRPAAMKSSRHWAKSAAEREDSRVRSSKLSLRMVRSFHSPFPGSLFYYIPLSKEIGGKTLPVNIFQKKACLGLLPH